MIKKGRHLIRNYMTLEYDFTGLRSLDGYLVPVDWKLAVDLVAVNNNRKIIEENEFEAGVTYQKIYFWLDTNLPNIIVVDVNNENDLYIANLSSNIMMYCPGIPSDDLIIQLLHAKICTLAKNNMMIGEARLSSSDTSLKYAFDCADTGYQLPTTTAEYYSEGTTRDKQSWWFRDDGFCFEFVRPENNDQTDEELFSDIIDPMTEFQKFVTDVSDVRIGSMKEPAKIVQIEKWKPKKV